MRALFCCILLVSAVSSWAQDTARPEKVGPFGNPHAIRIEGAEAYAPDEIREALLRSSDFVLGSHPAAPFDKFLEIVEGCLMRGYLSRGFSSPEVEVSWRAKDSVVVARIVEGPRFKAGSVRIVGARAVSEDKIRWWLIDEEREGAKLELDDRGEQTFKRMAREKELPPEVAQMMLGAGAPIPGNVPVLGTPNGDDDLAAPWSSEWWVNFTVWGKQTIRAAVARAYMEEGYQFCEFEVDYEDGKREGVKDLVVTVLDESPLSVLGVVILKGNAINTDEEVLRFLGLKKGMELKGPYEVELRRRLWDSGRFMGWNIMSWRAPDEAVVNLTICLAEHWEAPPLYAPLTREQEALMKFTRWLNANDGRDGDLVFTIEDLPGEWGKLLELTLNQEGGIFLKLEAQPEGSGILVESLIGDRVRTLMWRKDGRFHASVPAGDSRAKVYASLKQPYEPADMAPDDCGGNVGAGRFSMADVNMGMGLGKSVDRSTTELGIDPVLVFRATGSHSGELKDVRFGEGVVAVTDETGVLRFEEETGRLIVAEVDLGEEGVFRLALVPGRMGILEREFDEAAAGVPNALDGQNGWAMVIGFAGLFHELLTDPMLSEAPEDPGEFCEDLDNATRRARKWLPVACAVDGVLASVFGDDEEDEEEDPFYIPVDPERLIGMNWMAMILAGFYGDLARLVEPGSWPDLVLRETLFSFQGDTQYLEETVDVLFRDEEMGPLGCLMCARLLQRTGHPAARRFVEKSRGELNAEGFAKDWKLVLRGVAAEKAGGWQALKQFGALRDADLDPLLAEASPEFRDALKEVLAACRTIGKDADPEALAPVMDALWKHGLGKMVTTAIDSAAEELAPEVNPAKVGLVVNGTPVPRVAVRLDELFELPRFEANLEETWITRVLYAQQLWKQGMSMQPERVAKVRKMVLEGIGGGEEAEGWKKVKAEGIEEEQLDRLLEIIMTAVAYTGELDRKGTIEEAEVRAYYDQHRDQFRAGVETHVHRITIPKQGEGLDPAKQEELARRIHARLQLVEDPKKIEQAFRAEAREHSAGGKAANGGCLQWIVPEDWFNEKLARAIALVPDFGLSGVIDDGHSLNIIHIPTKRRVGQPKPFKEVEQVVRRQALLEKESRLLRERADIVRVDPPPPGFVYEEPEPDEEDGGVAEKVQGLLGSAMGEAEKKKERFGGAREDLPTVRKKAAEGDALFLYYLGTYQERGVGMPRDLAAAHKSYEQAAAAGEPLAMRRLAHLHFTGQGVERDEVKAKEWREKAAME